MSTYYYAVCEKHEARSHCVASLSAFGEWRERTAQQKALTAFLEAHGNCKPTIIDEHDGRFDRYQPSRGG